ncbi:hypothetical protein GPECTOR_3g142 [Gonium pectorale]|uniref:BTB domain-containing protein n=1 Tax=Gonium pectorale TaxID=33097 RepID=A0A150GYJ2_GONPE|nr:hypothetical protein GPECTOR_3g142 [Gonium pectorale]|eukprot:KXZ54976.1 hypothetical protein GPECTOR_3g142 [Gonium pectorale]
MYPGHRVVLAPASELFRQQLRATGLEAPGWEPTVTIRLRDPGALAAAELLLRHLYGAPLDCTALAPALLLDLALLAHDHRMDALRQALVVGLMAQLAACRPPGPPGVALPGRTAGTHHGASASGSDMDVDFDAGLDESGSLALYLSVLTACICLPADVADSGALLPLRVSARALLAEAFQDMGAAWRQGPLRAAFVRLPLEVAVELLSGRGRTAGGAEGGGGGDDGGGRQLAVEAEAGVLLAAMWYDVSRSEAAGAAAAAKTADEDAGGLEAWLGVGVGSGLAPPLSTAERVALYSAVRWRLLYRYIGSQVDHRGSFLGNALQRVPHLLPLLEPAAAHEQDTRLCCFVGVRPLLLLTEAEVAAASAAAACDGTSAAAAAVAVAVPGLVRAERFDMWNERDLPSGNVCLGPTSFSREAGFKGTTVLFELGPLLQEEAYWAKVMSAGQLRLRVRVEGLH